MCQERYQYIWTIAGLLLLQSPEVWCEAENSAAAPENPTELVIDARQDTSQNGLQNVRPNSALPLASVSGLVLGGDGQPTLERKSLPDGELSRTYQGVDQVQVTFTDKLSGQVKASAETDAKGVYQVQLAYGSYTIGVRSTGKSNRFKLPRAWSIDALLQDQNIQTDRTLDISLPIFTRRLTIVDQYGIGVPGIGVSIAGEWSDQGQHYVVESAAEDYRTNNQGQSEFTLFAFAGYRQTLQLPPDSGFEYAEASMVSVMQDRNDTVRLVLPDRDKPVFLTLPTITDVSDTKATLEWYANEPTLASIRYGLTAKFGHHLAVNTPANAQAIAMLDLIPDTEYVVQVELKDAAGNAPTTSEMLRFKTRAVRDRVAAYLSVEPQVVEWGTTTASIQWSTHERADTVLEYQAVLDDQAAPTKFSEQKTVEGLQLKHTVSLANLKPNQRYYCRVKSKDSIGNGPHYSPSISFKTLAAAAQASPFMIAGPTLLDVGREFATIIWETSELTQSVVSYNDGKRFQISRDDSLSHTHAMALLGLQPDTGYEFSVVVQDRRGQTTTMSGPFRFKTAAPVVMDSVLEASHPVVSDLPPPNLSQGGVAKEDRVAVVWQTNQPTASEVLYGTDAKNLWQRVVNVQPVVSHRLLLSNLQPDSRYYFQTRSKDKYGKISLSKPFNFTTSAATAHVAPRPVAEPVIEAISADRALITLSSTTEAQITLELLQEGRASQYFHARGFDRIQRIALLGLEPDRQYRYRVRREDAMGCVHLDSTPYTLRTTGTKDGIAPVNSQVSVMKITDNNALVHWVSNEPATASLVFNVQGQALVRQVANLSYAREHTLLLAGLQPGTPYVVRVAATDLSLNRGLDTGETRFTTTFTLDKEAPAFGAIDAMSASEDAATLKWSTDEFTVAEVRFGVLRDKLTGQAAVSQFAQEQVLRLQGLQAGLPHYYQITVRDMAGNSKLSAIQQFTTRGKPLDTDADSLADAFDNDDDADGIPDAVELANALNPVDAADAKGDLDRDGISNLAEHLGQTSLTQDSAPPVLRLPATVQVIASGPLTLIALGKASAYDARDGDIEVFNDAEASYPPGSHRVNWWAVDQAGNRSQATQLIQVKPVLRVATDQAATEGAQVRLGVSFTGVALSYPVRIPFTVSGTASEGVDHDLHPGQIVIDQGNNAELTVKILEDYAYDEGEYLEIHLQASEQVVVGDNLRIRLNIREGGGPSLRLGSAN